MRYRLWAVIVVLAALHSAGLIVYVAAPRFEVTLNPTSIVPEQGFAYIAPLALRAV